MILIIICIFVADDFSYKGLYFHNLTDDQRQQMLDYRLSIYQCKGTTSEKLEWFKIINIAGEELTPQELRNAVYSGSWVSDAKCYFSKNGCAAYRIGKNYISGKPIRQEFLQEAIKWASISSLKRWRGTISRRRARAVIRLRTTCRCSARIQQAEE